MTVDVSSAISPALKSGREVPLGEILGHHAGISPRAPALTVDDTTLSYEALEARANRRARAFAAYGVARGDFVTVALPNGMAFYETTFALWKLGAVPNVVAPKLPDAELGAIVTLVDPKLIIGIDPIRANGLPTLPATFTPDDATSGERYPSEVSPYWKAMTSGGSTGRPKVIVDHMPGMWDPATTSAGQILGDTLLNPGPLYHNAPFSCMHFGLFGGGHIIDMKKFDAELALSLIDAHRVGWINLVPTMMHRIMALPQEVRARYSMESLRVVFHMAAPCAIWLKRAWIDWLGPERIFELYGGTERQGATIITGQEWLERPGSVGRVQPGARMRVLRDDGSDCAPGEVGEVYFLPDAGRNASYHYIGAEAKATGEWESLGDLGYVDEAGYLFLSDRRTDLILSGGANIYPAEVEAALELHPAVACAVVVGLPDIDLGQHVHAIIELHKGMTLDAAEVTAHVKKKIAPYKVPRTVEFVQARLRDDAGKVRRRALRDARLSEP